MEWLDDPGKGVFFHFARGDMRLYDPGKDSFLHFARGDSRVHDPGKGGFFHFARGGMRVHHPSKSVFLRFARGSMQFFTLAKTVFFILPGSKSRKQLQLMHSSVLCQGYIHLTNDTRAAISISNGAPSQLLRQLHSQRRSAFWCAKRHHKHRYRLYHFATTPHSCARRLLYKLRLLQKENRKRRKRTGKGRKNVAISYIRAVKDSPHLGQ